MCNVVGRSRNSFCTEDLKDRRALCVANDALEPWIETWGGLPT